MKRAAICAAMFLAIAEAKKLRQEEQPVEEGATAEVEEDEPAEVAEEEEEGAIEYLEDYNVLRPGPEWYNWMKIGFGVISGLYSPINNRAQYYNCFGQTVEFGWGLY